MTNRRYLLASSGWLALVCTLLPAASVERIVPTVAFLALAPGAALVGLRRRLRRDEKAAVRPLSLEDGVFAVAASLSLAVLVSEGLFVGHAFSMARAMIALAGVTTLAALTPVRA